MVNKFTVLSIFFKHIDVHNIFLSRKGYHLHSLAFIHPLPQMFELQRDSYFKGGGNRGVGHAPPRRFFLDSIKWVFDQVLKLLCVIGHCPRIFVPTFSPELNFIFKKGDIQNTFKALENSKINLVKSLVTFYKFKSTFVIRTA